MKPVVYIDMLFLLNFLMDSVTLYATALFLRKSVTVLRAAITAAVGALYSTIMFFPQMSFLYSFIGKTAFLLIISMLAFPSRIPVIILKNALVFFVVNTVFGGIMIALIFATDFGTILGAAVSNGEIYLSISFELLLISAILAYTTVYIISYIKKQNIQNAKITAEITICFSKKQVTLSALCDTGCSLCDPISGAPAVVISPQIAKELLPPEIINGDFIGFEDKYRPLPFATVDNLKGILDGFIPDKLLVDGREISHSVVGISKTDMHTYSAIFNPELLENNTKRKAVTIFETPDTVA